MMIRPPNSEEDLNADRIMQATVNDFIKKQGVHSLGTPDDLLSVQVRPVGGERYRVNIVVGKDVTATRISNSFFLTADAVGNILTSSPKIDRQY
jgi:hypothetical protein